MLTEVPSVFATNPTRTQEAFQMRGQTRPKPVQLSQLNPSAWLVAAVLAARALSRRVDWNAGRTLTKEIERKRRAFGRKTED